MARSIALLMLFGAAAAVLGGCYVEQRRTPAQFHATDPNMHWENPARVQGVKK